MTDPTVRKVRAVWMRYDQIPFVLQNPPDVALIMKLAAVICPDDVTRPGIVAPFSERSAHDA